MFNEYKVLALLQLVAALIAIALYIVLVVQHLLHRHTTSFTNDFNLRILIAALVFKLVAILAYMGRKLAKEDQKDPVELEER